MENIFLGVFQTFATAFLTLITAYVKKNKRKMTQRKKFYIRLSITTHCFYNYLDYVGS